MAEQQPACSVCGETLAADAVPYTAHIPLSLSPAIHVIACRRCLGRAQAQVIEIDHVTGNDYAEHVEQLLIDQARERQNCIAAQRIWRITPDELAERRKRLGLSRPQLARALEVGEATVYRWEEGQRPIPPLLARALRDLERERRPAQSQEA